MPGPATINPSRAAPGTLEDSMSHVRSLTLLLIVLGANLAPLLANIRLGLLGSPAVEPSPWLVVTGVFAMVITLLLMAATAFERRHVIRSMQQEAEKPRDWWSNHPRELCADPFGLPNGMPPPSATVTPDHCPHAGVGASDFCADRSRCNAPCGDRFRAAERV